MHIYSLPSNHHWYPELRPRGPVIPSKLPPRRARLVVYNKRSNETSIWVVELTEVHAATRGGHHRGKVISSEVVPDVQPPMPHGFFNCSPPVDVPPSTTEMEHKENGASKPIPSGLLAKL
ncbi:uncharacterized protein M6B38_140600 [Iris pallida]|uniref:Amine oxidase n=1 Tax=Iris pallida TaxID=29817 RepID=A0AAX6FDI3_IRIPA|nr:uncharacterized protein M6B38_140600 [Iris pallida]